MKTYFVTGAARGLGRELTETILANGDQIFATARKPEQLADLVAQYPDKIKVHQLDVTDNDSVQTAVNAAFENFDRIDVVINNAGYMDVAFLEDEALDVIRQQIETNFFGPLYVTKAMLPFLREQKGGTIVNISSIMPQAANPTSSVYAAAKAAEIAFTESVAQEVAAFGIKMMAIEPGGMRTEFIKSATVRHISAAYRNQYADQLNDLINNTADNFPGDRHKAATAILAIAELDDLKTSIPLGIDALAISNKYAQDQLATNQKYADLITSDTADDFSINQ